MTLKSYSGIFGLAKNIIIMTIIFLIIIIIIIIIIITIMIIIIIIFIIIYIFIIIIIISREVLVFFKIGWLVLPQTLTIVVPLPSISYFGARYGSPFSEIYFFSTLLHGNLLIYPKAPYVKSITSF